MAKIIILLSILYFIGCRGSGEPDTGDKHGDSFLKCAEPFDDRTEEKFGLPPLIVERNGYDISVQGIKRGLVVFGLLAGITEPTAANLKNIDFFLDQFKAAGAQAVLVAGGVGLSLEEMNPILDRLSRAPVPVLICPGAQENFDIFRRAIAKKRKTSPQILDMTRVRRVRIGHVTVVSIPGYHKPFYLSAGNRGCAYEETDLQKTASLFENKRTTVVLSPSPPRGSGERSVDRSRGGVNIGDNALARILERNKIQFGLFGYVFESGGHATLKDGRTAAAPGVWQKSLFLQAGTSEAVPIALIGEGQAVGMAQMVEFSGRRGRYRTILANATVR
ncbi:MAG: hypothetical protein GY847_09990 [Proteobacteria bacterium]|nr:hypothetical protein [Pseudomonadota bacterium]